MMYVILVAAVLVALVVVVGKRLAAQNALLQSAPFVPIPILEAPARMSDDDRADLVYAMGTERWGHKVSEYPGVCPACGETMPQGEPIALKAGRPAVHWRCYQMAQEIALEAEQGS